MANETVDAGESTIHATETGVVGTPQSSPSESTANGTADAKPVVDVNKLQERVDGLLQNISKMQSERDKATAKLELLEKQHQAFSDKTLNDSQKANYANQRKALIDKINQGWDGEVAVDLFERVLADAEQGAVSKLNPAISEMKAELAELKKALKDSNPEKAKYADKIAELRAELPGMDDEVLLKIAKRDAVKSVRGASVAPGTTATQRSQGVDDTQLSDEQKAMIKSMYPKATDDELKAVARKLAARKGVK